MKRQTFRYLLLFCLLLSTGFASWAWLRPYSWHSDPASNCKVVSTQVTRDTSYFWVEVHLKVNPGMTHDLQKPVRLETTGRKMLEPADTTFSGQEEQGTTDIWFKFWLESTDLDGDLTLHLNDGKLIVKANPGIPQFGSSKYRNFTTNHW